MLKIQLSWLLLCAFVLAGCSQPAPPAPVKPAIEPVVSSFADGVTKLVSIRDEVKAAFDSGNPHDCDGAIHTAAEILHVLPNIAMDEGQLDGEAMETVKTASKQLFDQYMKLHHGFHGEHKHEEEEAGYAAVSDSIEEAMTKLQSVAGK